MQFTSLNIKVEKKQEFYRRDLLEGILGLKNQRTQSSLLTT